MNRGFSVPLLVASLVALGVALVAAGWLGTAASSAPPPRRPRPSAQEYHAPQFVQAVNGWLPAAMEDPAAGFEVTNCPWLGEIYDLAPGKGELPALEQPPFVRAEEATWLEQREPVLGLKIGDDTRCYPVRIMNYHSLVMDRLSGQAVYVFWDPPSGLALARRQWAQWRPLGIAGLGFRGVGLAYDPATGAIWDLFGGGPLSAPGKSLAPKLPQDYQWLPLERMTWRAWRRGHGNTLVLAQETGYRFNYEVDPYAAAVGPGGETQDYWTSEMVLAPERLKVGDELVPDKAPVLAFISGGEAWAAPVDELAVQQGEVKIETAGGEVTVHVNPRDEAYSVSDESGRWLPQVRMFWFAWKARFPETKLWHPEPASDE